MGLGIRVRIESPVQQIIAVVLKVYGPWTDSVIITWGLISANSWVPSKTNWIRKSSMDPAICILPSPLVILMAAKVWAVLCYRNARWGYWALETPGVKSDCEGVPRSRVQYSQRLPNFVLVNIDCVFIKMIFCYFTYYCLSPLSRWRPLGFKSFPSGPILLDCDATLSQGW